MAMPSAPRTLRMTSLKVQLKRLFSPVLGRTLRFDAQVEMLRRNEHLIRVFEAASLNTINPDRKCGSECRASFASRANKIGDHCAASLDDPVAHPAHAPGVFNPIIVTEPKIPGKISAHRVCVENYGIQ